MVDRFHIAALLLAVSLLAGNARAEIPPIPDTFSNFYAHGYRDGWLKSKPYTADGDLVLELIWKGGVGFQVICFGELWEGWHATRYSHTVDPEDAKTDYRAGFERGCHDRWKAAGINNLIMLALLIAGGVLPDLRANSF